MGPPLDHLDTSRVAITLAKQRLMTASFDYFALRYPHEGLRGGFIYKTVPHVTLKSIANNAEIDAIYERMHPAIASALAALNAALKTHAPATPYPVNVHARIWRTANASPDLLAKLQQRLATAFAERAELGRSVARSWITSLLHSDGVAAVDFVGNDAPPTTTTLFNDQFPTLGTVQLIDAGVM